MPEYLVKFYNPEFNVWAYLVIDNRQRGPGKGGVRMTPTVNEAEVVRLARAMTFKTALAGIAFGGAKAGITFDPKRHSRSDKRVIMEWFGRQLRPFVPHYYIAGPDVNTGETEMAWLVRGAGTRLAATGKPRRLGGLPHELGSTGYGVALTCRLALKFKKIPFAQATVAIEGFGNVGTFATRFLAETGIKIVAVSDSHGTAYLPTGLSYQKLVQIKKSKGSIVNYPGAKRLLNNAIFGLPVSVLIPAALPDVITKTNVDKVRAQIIVEGSNIPIAPKLETRLHRRGVLIIPDIIANAGGVISSYAEYRGFNQKKMFRLIETKITRSVRSVITALAKSPRTPPRLIALKLASKRLG